MHPKHERPRTADHAARIDARRFAPSTIDENHVARITDDDPHRIAQTARAWRWKEAWRIDRERWNAKLPAGEKKEITHAAMVERGLRKENPALAKGTSRRLATHEAGAATLEVAHRLRVTRACGGAAG
jgi:hypothetical protein